MLMITSRHYSLECDDNAINLIFRIGDYMSQTRWIRGPEEIKNLWERIGDTSEKVLRWLLCFANTDLSKQSEGQWQDFQEELREFLDSGPPTIRKKVRPWPHPGWGPPQPRARVREVSMRRNSVEHTQQVLRGWLEKLVDTHSLEFDTMSITLEVYHPRFF